MYSPPTSAELYSEFLRVAQTMHTKLGMDSFTKPPEKSWLIPVLSTICPDHPFFKKDYAPQPRQASKKQVLDNEDGFFSNLPVNPRKRNKVKSTLKALRANNQDC